MTQACNPLHAETVTGLLHCDYCTMFTFLCMGAFHSFRAQLPSVSLEVAKKQAGRVLTMQC